MYREIVSNGDLLLVHKPWYRLFSSEWIPHRNLSEEVRLLKEHRDNALSKYLDLSRSYVIASTNVGEDLETLQLHLLDNSEAHFEVGIDNSILEEREGIKYNFNSGGNNKKGSSSSNKENQQKQQQAKQNTQGKPKGIPVSKLLGASIILH